MFFFSKCLIPTISAVTSTGTARTALLSWRPVETASDSSTLTTHSPSSRYTFFSVCLIVSLLVFVFFPWICLACVFLDALTPKTQSRYIGIPENAVLRRKPTFTLHTGLSVGAQLRQFGQCCYNLVSVARIMPLVYGHLSFGHHNGTNVCVSGGRGCISIFVWFGWTLFGLISVLTLLCVSILNIRTWGASNW